MARDKVRIGGKYLFTPLPGDGPDGLDSTVGQYNEKIVTVLREQIDGVDEENRPMFIVQGDNTPEITVFEDEIIYNPRETD